MLVTKGFYFKVFVNKKETLAALTDFVFSGFTGGHKSLVGSRTSHQCDLVFLEGCFGQRSF
jgi:hypothetical protein